MPRLQLLELPQGPDDDRPPFALVLDEWTTNEYFSSSLASQIGARGALVFQSTVEIPANDTRRYLASTERPLLPAAGVPAHEDDPPVKCWHTEPGSPCDWDVCRQPERLARGDRGTDPATGRTVRR